MARPRIVIAEAYAADAVARLARAGEIVDAVGADRARLRACLHDAEALLVRTYTQVNGELLAAGPRLRVIGRGGVGVDNIDVAAAQARGITVVYTPAASTRSVAEHTWALLLALVRGVLPGDSAVRADRFNASRGSARFTELSEMTLGVIGMGRIGSTVAAIAARGFGMRVCCHDIAAVGPFDFAVEAVSLADLLASADAITLHVPLTSLTRNLINAETLARCRRGAILLNTARGGVVDPAALAEALHAGRLAGAAIDVFDEEPPPADHPLRSAPNILLSPHVAGRSVGALQRMNDVVDDVVRVLAGHPPNFAVPPSGW